MSTITDEVYGKDKIIADADLNGENEFAKFQDRIRYTMMMIKRTAEETNQRLSQCADKVRHAFNEGWHSDEVIEEIFGLPIPKDLRG